MQHEKLICYQSLLGITQEVGQFLKTWPRGHNHIADQLKRALSSAILNLAEGNGKRDSAKERRRFFQISMGSIAESCACLDLVEIFKLIPSTKIQTWKSGLKKACNQIGRLP